MEAVAVILCILAIVFFTGGLVGEILYASQLLGELRKSGDSRSGFYQAGIWLGLGFISSMRAKRLEPELMELSKENEVVARALPRFLFLRRARQIGFAVAAFVIVFLFPRLE